VKSSLTLPEAARALGVHYMTAYRYVRQGHLRASQVDGQWRVARADLTAFRAASRPARRPGAQRARTGTGRTVPTRHRGADWVSRMEACLLAGDEAGALGVVESALASGHDLYGAYLEVVSPALVRIGERWAQGRLDIFEEHRATGIVMRLIGQVGSRFARRGPRRGTVLIGAPAGEHHGLPIAMTADLVRHEGWRVSDVGADVPAEAFAAAARRTEDLVAVCVGVTMRSSLPAARDTIAAVRRETPDVSCFVGGAAVASEHDALGLGAHRWASSPRDLVAALETLARS
jgi:excisionase family DNA binding protein